MTTEHELWQEFLIHYRRDRRALALQGKLVVGIGDGAVGSWADALLARTGISLVAVDSELIQAENLMRHYLTDRRVIGQSKAHALARRLRAELPALQSIRGVKANIEALTDRELRLLVDGADVVLGCTGDDAVDRRLNRVTRDLGIPFVVPSMWAGPQEQVLGDLLVVAWNMPRRRGGCFECLRPERANAPSPAEAQPGLGPEVLRVANLTAETVLGLLLPESRQHGVLARQLRRGANYFLIPRWPPSLRPVITTRRRGCAACSRRSRRVNTIPLTPARSVNWLQRFFIGSPS